MKYHSTAGKTEPVGAKQALLSGLAADGGLFMPEHIPPLDTKSLAGLRSRTLPEIASAVLRPFFEPDIDARTLDEIVEGTFTFPAPLVPLEDGISLLELFHGPTLAFKDFGARFLARAMSKLRAGARRELWVLVATSGDTGSAVAQGFFKVPGIRVFILYPSGKVSALQEQQFTTLGGNITALEVGGTFDDCQALVKQAFLDPDLQRKIDLTSANSINIGRLLPQAVYYFSALAQLGDRDDAVFSVPSGNLGNLAAGIIARRIGLRASRFIAAVNVNGPLPEYLASGVFRPRPSVQTLSNAMDVGNPSNMARLTELYGGDAAKMREEICSFTVSDEASIRCIRSVYEQSKIMLDPHAAVGYCALQEYRRRDRRSPGIILGTAHPAKFPDTVRAACGESPPIPRQLEYALKGRKRSEPIAATQKALKEFLLAQPS